MEVVISALPFPLYANPSLRFNSTPLPRWQGLCDLQPPKFPLTSFCFSWVGNPVASPLAPSGVVGFELTCHETWIISDGLGPCLLSLHDTDFPRHIYQLRAPVCARSFHTLNRSPSRLRIFWSAPFFRVNFPLSLLCRHHRRSPSAISETFFFRPSWRPTAIRHLAREALASLAILSPVRG